MNDFVNYNQAKEILEQVKEYIDSQGGGGGEQRPVFYDVNCQCYSETGNFYFEPQSNSPFMCEIYLNNRKMVIEKPYNIGYLNVVYQDENFDGEIYFLKNTKEFVVKGDPYQTIYVRVLFGRLNVLTNPRSYTEIPSKVSYFNDVLDGYVYWYLNCYFPETDPDLDHEYYIGRSKSWNFVNNSNVIEVGKSNIERYYLLNVTNTLQSNTNVKIVLPKCSGDRYSCFQRVVSFTNQSQTGIKHIKIVGESGEFIFDGNVEPLETIKIPIYFNNYVWYIGKRY